MAYFVSVGLADIREMCGQPLHLPPLIGVHSTFGSVLPDCAMMGRPLDSVMGRRPDWVMMGRLHIAARRMVGNCLVPAVQGRVF